MGDLRDRFDAKWTPEPMSGCWLWTGTVDLKQYGRFSKQGRLCSAHRIAWELYRGSIPTDRNVLHRCDNPSCVNPDHLFLGTLTDNMRDMARKGRSYSQRLTHCPAGHPYNDANTYLGDKGYRRCRVCRARIHREYRARIRTRLFENEHARGTP